MKIIKEFEDDDFFAHPKISSPEYHGRYTWLWGLGDDGFIYYRSTRFSHPDEWRELSSNERIAILVSLKTMKKLVNQFGHLLVFI
jgi:hypothetical protein